VWTVQYIWQPEGHYAATHFDGKRFTYQLHMYHLHLHKRENEGRAK
jgi:hypothetical protein